MWVNVALQYVCFWDHPLASMYIKSMKENIGIMASRYAALKATAAEAEWRKSTCFQYNGVQREVQTTWGSLWPPLTRWFNTIWRGFMRHCFSLDISPSWARAAWLTLCSCSYCQDNPLLRKHPSSTSPARTDLLSVGPGLERLADRERLSRSRLLES